MLDHANLGASWRPIQALLGMSDNAHKRWKRQGFMNDI